MDKTKTNIVFVKENIEENTLTENTPPVNISPVNISLVEAQQKFVQAVPMRHMAAETCDLSLALGRTLYHNVLAPMDAPPYHRAIVEGYLVHTASTASATEAAPAAFKIVGSILPGDTNVPSFGQTEALTIVTGSLIPSGAYSAIRPWDAQRQGEVVSVNRPFPPRFFIEDQGCDIKKGALLLEAGMVLQPQQLGLLAGLGIRQIDVAKAPKLTLFSSGNEVIPHTEPFRIGCIYDSNAIMLAAAARQAGAMVEFVGIMNDNFENFVAQLTRILPTTDMVVISGGTAVGGRDFITDLIKAVGDVLINGIPMKSGRPLIMGMAGKKPIVCVAGHPPEALRGFTLFGVAAINRLLGRNAELPLDAAT